MSLSMTSSLCTSSTLPRRTRPRPSLLKRAPIYLMMLLSLLLSLMNSAFTLAAPIDSDKADNNSILDDARDGPFNVTVQAGIAGGILILAGFILCFFGYRIFHVTMFLIGFYFFGNLTYIGMA